MNSKKLFLPIVFLIMIVGCQKQQSAKPIIPAIGEELKASTVWSWLQTEGVLCYDKQKESSCTQIVNGAGLGKTEGFVKNLALSNNGAIKLTVTSKWKLGMANDICSTPSEAEVDSISMYHASNMRAFIGPADVAILGEASKNLIEHVKRARKQELGIEICTKFEVASKSENGRVESVELIEYIDGLRQGASRRAVAHFFGLTDPKNLLTIRPQE